MNILKQKARRHGAAAALLVCALVWTAPACKHHKKERPLTIEEGDASMASIVHTADPRTSTQLLSGFYGIEGNAWRWTAQRFSVLLRPPRSAATKGATLQLKLTIPAVAMDQLKTVTLSAAVAGTPLSPETYTQAGPFTYTRDVPASALGGDSVKVDFVLDKAVPPGPSDQRQLGIIVSTVGFEAK
ncbi:MAG: hypothetical protein U0Q18_20320 [Bryobacteraceae bacterium]